MNKYFELIILIAVLGFVAIAKTSEKHEPAYVLMISFDGFRHDYVEKYDAPHFKAFIEKGAKAEALTPSFPSKTFPNHYSLVTGMYPGNHGLVDNSFYDEELDVVYRASKRELVENPAFYGGLPLWQLTQQNGMKSASYFWVGSEAPVAGSFPDYYYIYDGSVSNEARIDEVVRWLNLPEEDRPHFISLYFSLVDSQGHATGPDSPETGEAVLEADRLLGLLMAQIESIDLPINVVITSDHGMNTVPTKEETLINVDSLFSGFDRSQFRVVNNGAHAHVYVDDEALKEELFSSLQNQATHFRVYKKEQFPQQWHYEHKRIGELLITMDPGHYLVSRGQRIGLLLRGKATGQHGFDPASTPDMGGIFYAKGPNIKSNQVLPPIENVHVYPFVAHLMGIDKLPQIDGNLKVLKSIYKE